MPDAPPSEPGEPPTELDAAAYQRALAVLLDVGTSIVLELKTASADITVVARAAAFDRLALAVRRTIILSRHIAEHAVTPVSAEARRVTARKQVLRAVEDTIDHRADPADAKHLRVELLERLDSPDFDLDLTHRSPADLIRDLCRDFGLANQPHMQRFPRRTPDDIAILCAQAAAPSGSGLPQWLAAAASQPADNDLAPDHTLKQRRHL